MDVCFLDTGFHFPETLAYRDRLAREFGLRIRDLTTLAGQARFRKQYGKLYKQNPQMCCYLNKVEPLQRALNEKDAWISGIRRDQTQERAHTPVVTLMDNGKYKICPMVQWTQEQVDRYIQEHELPLHSLFNRGYRSIGCKPCTVAVTGQQDYRAGRWSGSEKTECGLHLPTPDPGNAAGE